MKPLVLCLVAAGALMASGGEQVNLLSGNPVPGGSVWPDQTTRANSSKAPLLWAEPGLNLGSNAPSREDPIPNLRELLRRGTNYGRSNLAREYFLKRRAEGFADASGLLKPGTYETRPYTMIVRAPEPVDQKGVVNPEGNLNMLRTVPRLEFVPRDGSPTRTNATQGK